MAAVPVGSFEAQRQTRPAACGDQRQESQPDAQTRDDRCCDDDGQGLNGQLPFERGSSMARHPIEAQQANGPPSMADSVVPTAQQKTPRRGGGAFLGLLQGGEKSDRPHRNAESRP